MDPIKPNPPPHSDPRPEEAKDDSIGTAHDALHDSMGGEGSSLAGRVTTEGAATGRSDEARSAEASPPAIGSFDEMTKRIPAPAMAAISAKMDAIEDFPAKLEALVSAMRDGNYDSINEASYYILLRGMREGGDLSFYLQTAMNVILLKKEGLPFTVIDLDGDLESLPREKTAALLFSMGPHLNEERAEALVTHFQRLPPQQKKLILFESRVPYLATPEEFFLAMSRGRENVSSSQLIDSQMHFNVQSRVPFEGMAKRMAPHLPLLECILQSCFDEPVHTNPIFGLSTLEQIRQNGLTNSRDIALPYLVPDEGGNRLVHGKEADRFQCKEDEFTRHDMYHAFAASSHPAAYRRLSIETSDQLHAFADSHPELSPQDRKALLSLRAQLIDMDYPQGYRSSPSPESAEERFVSAILQPLRLHLDLLRKEEGDFTHFDKELLKPFETKEACYEAYALIIRSIPNTPEFVKAKHKLAESLRLHYPELAETPIQEALSTPS